VTVPALGFKNRFGMPISTRMNSASPYTAFKLLRWLYRGLRDTKWKDIPVEAKQLWEGITGWTKALTPEARRRARRQRARVEILDLLLKRRTAGPFEQRHIDRRLHALGDRYPEEVRWCERLTRGQLDGQQPPRGVAKR